jgi:hypothetical protein
VRFDYNIGPQVRITTIYLLRFRDFRAMRRALAPVVTAAGGAPALKPEMPPALLPPNIAEAAPLLEPMGKPPFIPRGGAAFPFAGCGFNKPFDGSEAW